MSTAETILNDLRTQANDEKRQAMTRFFKTGKGEYGEGDVFLGVTVPKVRAVAKEHRYARPEELHILLMSEYHEARLCALLIMVLKCERKDNAMKQNMLELYLEHTHRINNWDLVDLSAPAVVGEYLVDKPRNLLYRLAESNLLWENRIAMVATLALIRHNELDDTYMLAKKMMNHRHDLMKKATGWMLREAGKRDEQRLYDFVEKHRSEMPRTMLRYAIEKFTGEKRLYLMGKQPALLRKSPRG